MAGEFKEEDDLLFKKEARGAEVLRLLLLGQPEPEGCAQGYEM